MTSEEEKLNYVDLFKATIKTLNEKKCLTKALKDKAMRFYFLMSDMKSKFDKETLDEYNNYYRYLKERKVLI